MKYFDQLPKRSFETTNGTYSISDFFSYYKFNFDLVSKKEFEFDSKTTLIEAASKLYEDPNSFWLLLLANSWINPFTLLEDNSTEFNKKNQEKYVSTLGLQIGTTGFYMLPGSIVLPYAATGGNPYDYSYIGNFNLDGPIFVVEDQDSYTKKITVKPQVSGMSLFTDMNPNYQYIDFKSPTGYITSTVDNITSIASEEYLKSNEVIQYSTVSNNISFKNMAFADIPPVYNEFVGQPPTTQYNKEEAVVAVNKKINTFVPSELSKVTRNLITVKYT